MTAQQYTGEAVSLLSHLIATPSVSRDERRAADIMEEELHAPPRGQQRVGHWSLPA